MAAYSQWTLAIYAWNKEEMQRGVQYPGKVFWQQLLVRPLSAFPTPAIRCLEHNPVHGVGPSPARDHAHPCLSGQWPSVSKSRVT